MIHITEVMYSRAYELGKAVYQGRIERRFAQAELERIGMGSGSTSNYLYVCKCFFEGKEYKRTISSAATDYYLRRIQAEEGSVALSRALQALKSHIAYYTAKSKSETVSLNELLKKFEARLDQQQPEVGYYEAEFEGVGFLEGKAVKVILNAYERNREARQKCIDHYGWNCKVCDFNFEEVFGALGKDFIHVHHVVNLASIGREYTVNPITDLVPVCPNCHAMLHKKNPAYTVEDLKRVMQRNRS